MAKKKINIKSVTADVPSGDVNITYKNVRIAGLSESTTAVLETEDTICEDDIEVEYTKPEAHPASIPVSVINTSTADMDFGILTGYGCNIVNNNLVATGNIDDLKAWIPEYVGIYYQYGMQISTSSDILNITVNGNAVQFDNGDYNIYDSVEQLPSSINIIITDK